MSVDSTFTANQLYDFIDKLMLAAGRLSDVQELGCDKTTSNIMNAAKSDIFDVIKQLDPRKETK